MKFRMDEVFDEETSEYNSGCESGWTMYLDQSYENYPSTSPSFRKVASLQEEEEEDLSMVSDASSGPPHYHHQEVEQCCCGDSNISFSSPPPPPPPPPPPNDIMAKNGGKRRRIEASGTQQATVHEKHTTFLDDTASSPVFSFSKINDTNNNKKLTVKDLLEFPCDFSATHFKACKDGGEKKPW